MAGAWKLQRRQGECAACGRTFLPEEVLFSLLRWQDDDLQRGDLCSSCFEERDPEQDLFFWRTTHKESRGALRIDFEMLLQALPKLTADRRPERRDFAFLLALLLVRHRKLRLLTVTRRQKLEYLVLRKPRTKSSFEVEVRELDPERRQRLSNRLTELLDPTREGSFEELVTGEDGLPAAEPEPGA